MDMLSSENFKGPWAGLPVAWTGEDAFDEQVYRRDVANCCQAGIPGVYTGGTTGEFYAMEFDEFKTVARATIEECRANGAPSMIGCSSTYVLGAVRRAAFASELGADAIQIAMPYWTEMHDAHIVPFCQEISSATGNLPLSIYETTRAKKTLTLEQHRTIKETIPNYLMVKANAGTIGLTPEGCRNLTQWGINVFVDESEWARLGPSGACGCCSALVFYNPRIALSMWQDLQNKNWESLREWCQRVSALHDFISRFTSEGFLNSALDRLGGVASGFLGTSLRSREPYRSVTSKHLLALRQWYEENFPEMLEL